MSDDAGYIIRGEVPGLVARAVRHYLTVLTELPYRDEGEIWFYRSILRGLEEYEAMSE